jgi:hypothetical protein
LNALMSCGFAHRRGEIYAKETQHEGWGVHLGAGGLRGCPEP